MTDVGKTDSNLSTEIEGNDEVEEDEVEEDEVEEDDEKVNMKLLPSQRARIERNRQKALLLKQSRLASHPYATDEKGFRVKGSSRQIDTGAGFFIEEEEDKKREKVKIIHPEGPPLEVDNQLCTDCGKEFLESYLLDKFEELVCETCRKNEEKHPLITKTEAKKTYMLKDVDLDKREPILKFIVRKNPHNPRWGDMKLFYEPQVADRALEVWGSEEKMEEAREKRGETRDKSKQKKFDKKIKDLRMTVRGSLAKKKTSTHVHEYAEETYDEEEDTYTKKCLTCSHTLTYEKM